MTALETEFNQWHYQSFQPAKAEIDQASSPTKYVVSIHDYLQALQVMDNKEGAASIRESLQLMRKAHPDIAFRSRLELGVESMLAENSERARDIFLSVVSEDPAYVEGWAFLATCEFMMGLHKEAIQSIHKVLELDPTHFHGMTQLGLLHYENDEYKEAETCFRKCLDLDPWSLVAYKLSDCVSRLAKDKEE
jgi:tetratricopeptide (TPR) repeat protein